MLLFGCSSTGKLHVEKSLNKSINSRSKVAVYVHPHDKIKEPSEEYKESIQQLKNELYGRLVSDRVFKQVVNYEEDAKYKLNVSLVSADKVSQSARMIFGVLAGSNEIKAQVDLINIDTGKELTQFTVSGKSASHPMSSENDMDAAIKEITDKIIAGLT